MTVLVGVLCRDGVVIGSDSSMTFLAGQFRTVEQPAAKTFIVEPDVIFAGTGACGLGQRFRSALCNLRSKQDWVSRFQTDRGYIEAGKCISRAAIEDFGSTQAPKGQFGALVAFSSRKDFHLCEFATEDFQPEFKNSAGWFVSMGSGQPIVDPFFGLIRKTLLKGQQPSLEEGKFAAMWALLHAIELNPGGINGPVQLATLSNGKKGHEATLLDEAQLEECKGMVEAVESHIAGFREKVSKSGRTAIPQPKPPISSVDAPLG